MSFAPPSIVASASPTSDGNAATATPLSIGSVIFRSEECPSRLPIGAGEQKLTVIELIGGGRVVQSFGVQPKPVTWRGALYGPYVQPRIAQLRAIMVAGKPVSVSWLNERYMAIVRAFLPTYHHQWMAQYEITIEITKDSNGAFSTSSATSIDSQVSALSSDMKTKLSSLQQLDPAETGQLAIPFASVAASLQSAGPLAQATLSQITAILGSITTARNVLTQYGSLIGQLDARYISYQSILSILAILAANVSRGQTPKTIQVQGSSFYEIAAMQFGDIRQAFALAQANGRSSLRLPVSTISSVAIPPLAQVVS